MYVNLNRMIMEEKIIEINVSLSYKEKEVFIKSLNTNEIPAELLLDIMRSLNSSINYYFEKYKKDE